MLLSLFDYKISTKTVCNCVSYSIFGIYMESNFFSSDFNTTSVNLLVSYNSTRSLFTS